MQKYVPEETLKKLKSCFYNKKEFTDFVEFIESLSQEINFLNLFRLRCIGKDGKPDKEQNKSIMMQELCFLCVFLNKNLDLIHQLLSVYQDCDYEVE